MQTARILGDTRFFVCVTVYFRKYPKTKRVKKSFERDYGLGKFQKVIEK